MGLVDSSSSSDDGWTTTDVGSGPHATNEQFSGADVARAFLLRKAERLREARARQEQTKKLRRERWQQNRHSNQQRRHNRQQHQHRQRHQSRKNGSTSSWSSSWSYWQPEFDAEQRDPRFGGHWDGDYFNPHADEGEAEGPSMHQQQQQQQQPDHDWYDVLGVQPTATALELRKAFLRKSKLYHPDKVAGEEEQMKLLNEANAVLRDPEKRAAYDASRREQQQQQQASADAEASTWEATTTKSESMPWGETTVFFEEEVFHSPFHTAFPGVDVFQSMHDAFGSSSSSMGFQNAHFFESVW